MERSELVADRSYYDHETGLFFHSPDGTGVYWYDTYEELVENHGTPATGLYSVEYLTDF